MESLRTSKRVVPISEPILAEDSTQENLALSLVAVLEQLGKNAKPHDYLVGLLLVLLAESDFRVWEHCFDAISYKDSLAKDNKDKWISRLFPKFLRTKLAKKPTVSANITSQSGSSDTADISTELGHSSSDQNTRIVYIPQNWKSPETGVYDISLVLNKHYPIQSKLFATPQGNKMILNMIPCVEEESRTYSLTIDTLKYINPRSWKLCNRYKNLKEISHRFKNNLTTPTRTDILSTLNLMNPSLQGLPLELQHKILKSQIWQKLLYKDFYALLSVFERGNPKKIRNARARYIKSLQFTIKQHEFLFRYKCYLLDMSYNKEPSEEIYTRKLYSKTMNLHPKYFDHTLITPHFKEPLHGYYSSMISSSYNAIMNPRFVHTSFSPSQFLLDDDDARYYYYYYYNYAHKHIQAIEKDIARI